MKNNKSNLNHTVKKTAILVVEDNSILQRQLKLLLNMNRLECIIVDNELQAIDHINDEIFAVVADYDLSEKGGAADGGMKLAIEIAKQGCHIPFILISNTPPSVNAEEFARLEKELHLHAILNRNEETFRENLIEKLGNLKTNSGLKGEKQ